MSVMNEEQARGEYLGLTKQRTSCACDQCKIPCRIMPGHLLPEDLKRLAQRVGMGPPDEKDIMDFAMQYLAASPGAKVMKNGTIFSIPTLVPRMVDGACIFFTKEGLCGVHDSSPFGCGYFDSHQSASPELHTLASWGLQQIWDDMKVNGIYRRAWEMLRDAGIVGEPLETLHYRMKKAFRKAQ